MSDQASPSVIRRQPCHSTIKESGQLAGNNLSHHASNQFSRRRRPHSFSNHKLSEPKQSTATSQKQQERQKRLRKEQQRDSLLAVATIIVLVLVIICSFVLYHVWKSQQQQQAEIIANNINSKLKPPPSNDRSHSNTFPGSMAQERDIILHWKKELEALDQVIVDNQISKSDILLNPDLLPFRNGTINWRHWKGHTSFQEEDAMDSLFFKRSRLFDTFPWEEDEDMSNRKIRKEDEEPDPYSGGPYLDYTNPSLYKYKQSESDYPQLSTLGEIFSAWPQDNIDHPPTPILETLQHFDYTKANELQEAWKYMEQQLPFKLTKVPELLEANQKWTDAYVAKQFGGGFAKGNCQESPTSFFAFFNRKMWKVATMGLPPTRDNDFAFRKWAKHARYADHERLSSQRPHFYWQAGVPKEERYQPKDTWSFFSLDLPSFSTTEPNIFCPDPSQSKGMQCRFGERGVTAANHFDGGQNMVAMITGAKRYILSPPNQCHKLAVQTERGTALYRHSLLNMERLSFADGVASDLEREWLLAANGARAVETVVKAGEVLFIPSHWFHYIISLQKNAQCNVRSGVNVEGNDQFGGQHDVSAEGCK